MVEMVGGIENISEKNFRNASEQVYWTGFRFTTDYNKGSTGHPKAKPGKEECWRIGMFDAAWNYDANQTKSTCGLVFEVLATLSRWNSGDWLSRQHAELYLQQHRSSISVQWWRVWILWFGLHWATLKPWYNSKTETKNTQVRCHNQTKLSSPSTLVCTMTN